MKYKTSEDKIGEVVLNKQGTPMKLVAYRNVHDCDIEFQDEYKYIFKHAIYNNFRQGKLKNPYDKTVYGIGMMGDGKYKSQYTGNTVMSDEYVCWRGMISRCYVNENAFPSYYNISTVCDKWLNFQNFGIWYEENAYELPNNERLHLDKDILIEGNKHYSPETCLFVPQSINMLFSNMYKYNKSGLPNGIRASSNGEKYTVNCMGNYLGTYPTLKRAYSIYVVEKEKAIKQKADEYKHLIPEKVYNALYKYKVQMENDKNLN